MAGMMRIAILVSMVTLIRGQDVLQDDYVTKAEFEVCIFMVNCLYHFCCKQPDNVTRCQS